MVRSRNEGEMERNANDPFELEFLFLLTCKAGRLLLGRPAK